MARRVVIWVLTAVTVIVVVIGMHSVRYPIILYGRWGGPVFVHVSRGSLVTEYDRTLPASVLSQPITFARERTRFQLLGFTYKSGPQFNPMGGAVDRITASLRLSSVALLTGVIPVLAFVLRPIRSTRRRSRRECFNCGYSLIGNQSGVCPECGMAHEAWITPRWKRVVIAVLIACVVTWIVHFIDLTLALDHRIALWMIQRFGHQDGSWLLSSAILSFPTALACIGVFIYLSPERFKDS